jgi:hypothetical protein
MHGVDEERIRARAYELWEGAGRSGDPQEHWLRAERECAVSPNGAAPGKPSGHADEAGKMAEQVQVAMDGRKARSKQGGRAGATGLKKSKTASAPEPEPS